MTADRPKASVQVLAGISGAPVEAPERLLLDEQLAERISHHLLDTDDPLPTRLARIAFLLGEEGYRYDPDEATRLRETPSAPYDGPEEWG